MAICRAVLSTVCLILLTGTLRVTAQSAAQSSARAPAGASALASASFTPTIRHFCIPQEGLVHPGTAYNQSSISAFPEDCCSFCNSDPRCQAWSFSLANETCLLKEEDAELVPDELYVSGVVGSIDGTSDASRKGFTEATRLAPGEPCYIEEGVSFPGDNVLLRHDAADPESCCESCWRTEICYSWHFNHRAKRCVLNINVPDRVYKDGFSGGSVI